MFQKLKFPSYIRTWMDVIPIVKYTQKLSYILQPNAVYRLNRDLKNVILQIYTKKLRMCIANKVN